MTTREEFVGRLGDVVRALPDAAKHDAMRAVADVVAAWDTQAAEVTRLKAEVARVKDALASDGRLLAFASMDLKAVRDELERIRTGVPLTAENVADAVEVEDCFGVVSVRGGDGVWRSPGWEDESDRTMVECIKHHKFVVTKWRKG